MEWVRREIKDQDVQYPYRYDLVDINTNEVVGTYDIIPDWGEIYQNQTEINAKYLQLFEDYLVVVNQELIQIGLRLDGVGQQIENAHTRIDNINKRIETLAPLDNPVLSNPTANTVPISTNSNNVATTSAVYAYLNSLFSSYVG